MRGLRNRLFAALVLLAAYPLIAQAQLSPGAQPTSLAAGFNLSSLAAATRYNLWNTTLTPLTNTTNIWENYSSFVTLNGPGQANGEINTFHSNITINSGALAAQSEGYEAKLENAGTVTEWDGALLIPQNGAAGTATRLYGAKCQLTQANAVGAAVGTYACLNNEAMTGGGSQPTANMFLRNADANAWIGTLGDVNIGDLSDNSARLFVKGSGATSGTFSFIIKNSALANEFFCQDDPSCTAAGGFTVNGLLKVPNVATGTPVASLCIDSSNNVIKKTTTGACV